MGNQTIIQAARAAFTKPKTDYSGFFQGLSSVATALNEKRKQVNKKNDTIGALDAGDVTIPQYKNVLEQYRLDIANGVIDYNEGIDGFKSMAKDFNKVQTAFQAANEAYDNLSGSVSPEVEAWLTSIKNQEFDASFFKIPTEGPLANKMHVIGPDGNYTTIDNIMSSFPQKTDANGMLEAVSNFSSKTVNLASDDPEIKEHSTKLRNDLKKEIENNKYAKQTFMVDGEFYIGNKKHSFLDWYFSEKMYKEETDDGWKDPEFVSQWNDFLNDPETQAKKSNEDILKTEKLILQSALENDKDLMDDFDDFIGDLIDQSL